MRTHATIIKDAGGPHAVAGKLADHDPASLATLQSRVRGWSLTGSIPGEYWALFAKLEIASVEELAGAAEARRIEKSHPEGAAAA